MTEAMTSSRGAKGKQATPRRDPDQPLRLERRTGQRTRARAEGVATFVDPDGRLWLTRIALLDRSEEGFGLRCPVPVAPGASFTLAVGGGGPARQGVVAHARARGGAYRLGLRCSPRMAA